MLNIKTLVTENTKGFYSGPSFKCHTFGPGGFQFGEGHKLCTPLDEVAGYTEVKLERRDVIGDIMNNFIGDATLALNKKHQSINVWCFFVGVKLCHRDTENTEKAN